MATKKINTAENPAEVESNLALYDRLRAVPDIAKKTITAGKLKGFTDINPMWRIKTLTDVFGACGSGWYTETTKMWVENAGGESAAFVTINLYVCQNGVWSSPIFGIGGSKLAGKGVGDGINDEAFKMAYTDALSIACKALGMAADVYYNKDVQTTDNRTKYDLVQAAPAPVQTVSAYKPMETERYWKYVAGEAKKERTASGRTMREAWIGATHADEEAIIRFDNDVMDYLASSPQ